MLLTDIWDITGTGVERHLAYNEDYEVSYTQLKFTILLKRKPLFYVINIVIPFSLLILVVLMVTSYN